MLSDLAKEDEHMEQLFEQEVDKMMEQMVF